MKDHRWKVVPLCDDQMRDIRKEDVVEFDGVPLFRRCHTYRGGGGYDLFPQIAYKRQFVEDPDLACQQFVVQLYGCNLDCPYCYVTREGVWGAPVSLTTDQLIQAWKKSRLRRDPVPTVFHLMGGAPALHLPHWTKIVHRVAPMLFHSDLMLTERQYTRQQLNQLNLPNVLLAVNIKGTTEDEWLRNTRKPLNRSLFFHNLEILKSTLSWRNWYLTFTGCDHERSHQFVRDNARGQDYFNIDLIDYDAMPYVDNRAWGAQQESAS